MHIMIAATMAAVFAGMAFERPAKRRFLLLLGQAHAGPTVVGRVPNHRRKRVSWDERVASFNSPAEFTRRYRLNKANFDKVLELIRPQIKPKRSDGISPEIKLACTLRWLAGGSYLDVRPHY